MTAKARAKAEAKAKAKAKAKAEAEAEADLSRQSPWSVWGRGWVRDDSEGGSKALQIAGTRRQSFFDFGMTVTTEQSLISE